MGFGVVGLFVGFFVGALEALVGFFVGEGVDPVVVGFSVGALVGFFVGEGVPCFVSMLKVISVVPSEKG